MSQAETLAPSRFALPFGALGAFGALLVALVAAAYQSLAWMVGHEWFGSEDYSHSALVPLIVVYLIRQRSDAFMLPARGAEVGLPVLALGLVAVLIGNLGTVYALAQYGFLISVFGAYLVAFGRDVLRRHLVALSMLALMIPLPNFFYQPLSSELQLLSSELGVFFIRGLGISVYLHGNVIDLGMYQLQVLEACNGLRYLFPLLSLGALFGYLYRGPTWQKWLLLVSTVPIAVVLNSLRIGVIGVAVEHWGVGAAEGLVHAVEGWAIFMLCVGLLLLEAKVLTRARGVRGRLLHAFDTGLPTPPAGVYGQPIAAPRTFVAALVMIVAATVVGAMWLRGETQVSLARDSFVDFPLAFDGWSGRSEPLDAKYLDALKLDDYLFAIYAGASGAQVNLYAAFYGSQLAGQSVHSPRSCLPGEGWEISSLETIALPDPSSGAQLPINRVVIVRGVDTQLVYYWFEQRGRVLANEYLVKWYILRDALSIKRTDGALVRLSMPVVDANNLTQADATLARFFAEVKPRMPRYVPD